jgi:hypothetical protein
VFNTTKEKVMKVKLTVTERDYNVRHVLDINQGKRKFYIHDLCECPEDAIIGRDLIDGQDLIDVMKMAYEAGKNGELLEIEEVKGS